MLALLVFPGTQDSRNHIACEGEQIVDDSHNPTPAIELLWGAQTGIGPKQGLFVKAIAMFLSETQTVRQSHLGQAFLWILSDVDKPADLGIAFRIGCV